MLTRGISSRDQRLEYAFFPLLSCRPDRDKKNITSPEISFTTVIEQLKSDKLELIGERTGIEQEISKANELKRRAEDEATRLRSIVQASEIDKQVLQQQVHSLTGMVSYFRNTTMTSVDDFINRLKHDLNSCTGE